MNIKSWTGSVVATSRRAQAIAAAAFATLALGMTVLLAPSASAASTTPGDFTSRIQNNPSGSWVGDCWVELGFVYDPHLASTGWHHVGGVRVTNCLSRHNFIAATVALYYSYGGRWVQYGNSGYGAAYNVTGWGYDLSDIVDTPSYCLYGWRGYWIVGATVSTEQGSRTVFSQVPAVDQANSGAC